jgi:hypothetical protein
MYKIKKPLPLLQETKANNLCGTTLVPSFEDSTQNAVTGKPGAAY